MAKVRACQDIVHDWDDPNDLASFGAKSSHRLCLPGATTTLSLLLLGLDLLAA